VGLHYCTLDTSINPIMLIRENDATIQPTASSKLQRNTSINLHKVIPATPCDEMMSSK